MLSDKDFYKNIVDNLPEGVVVCDKDQNIIEVNKNFERLTGFCREDILGKCVSEFLRSSGSGCSRCEEEALIPEQECKIKTYYIGELKDKDEKLTCVRVNFSLTRDDKTIYIVIPLADVAFLNRAHIDFVSTVSHELRTPLTSIKGFADTLLTSGHKLSPEQQNKFLNIIKSQVDRLTRLVENLLTVSKLESQKDKSIFKAVELQKFFENIINNIQMKAQGHTIKSEISQGLPPVWVDSDKFEQIVTNLVDNAIKYSNKGTLVKIEAKYSEEFADSIEINVIDQGVGIPEAYLSKIFTKFARIDNPLTRQVEGTGLGLYITKTLVEKMGGRIKAKSEGQGSTFTLIFPMATLEKPTQKKF
jgi:PAS domain S-box-containing protein